MKTFITRDTTQYPIPSGYVLYDGFKRLGWEAYYRAPISEGGKKLFDYTEPADILFDYVNVLSDSDHIEELKLFKERNPDCKIFVSALLPYNYPDTTEPDRRFEQYKGLVDYFFNSTLQHNKAKADFEQLGLSYLSIPYSCIVNPQPENLSYEYDTSFIGTVFSGERLTDVWYPEIVKPPLKTFLAGLPGTGGVEFIKMLDISFKTKVVLNPHYLYQVEEKENDPLSRIDFNTRVFNLAGLGCFQLTNHTSFKKVFGDSYPVFDRDNFKDMLDFYLNNQEERLKVAKSAQQITLQKYTSEIFARKISENNFDLI